MRVAILFDNLGPYHLARLTAAASRCDLLAVEFGARSMTYHWRGDQIDGVRRVVINPDGASADLSTRIFRKRLDSCLRNFVPSVVMVPGWSSREALLSLQWCLKNSVPAVVMSESTAWDISRSRLGETIKRRVVRLFTGALVGGAPHLDYVVQLGMNPNSVEQGYDVVDNDYFQREVAKWRSCAALGAPYFLASARFIPRKNLDTLIEAYARYANSHQSANDGVQSDSARAKQWDLVLLGDGEMRTQLMNKARGLGVQIKELAPWEEKAKPKAGGRLVKEAEALGTVWMPGLRQIDELPRFYAGAGCFIHPSMTEQWGLVVNEAMASGLPVLVSQRCGCARDLVQDGLNGFQFCPMETDRLAALLRQIADDEAQRAGFGKMSETMVHKWGPSRFGSAVFKTAQRAVKAELPRARWSDYMLLHLLQARQCLKIQRNAADMSVAKC